MQEIQNQVLGFGRPKPPEAAQEPWRPNRAQRRAMARSTRRKGNQR